MTLRVGGRLSAGSCILLWTPWSGASLRVLVIAALSTLGWATRAVPIVFSVRDRLLYLHVQISFSAGMLPHLNYFGASLTCKMKLFYISSSMI